MTFHHHVGSRRRQSTPGVGPAAEATAASSVSRETTTSLSPSRASGAAATSPPGDPGSPQPGDPQLYAISAVFYRLATVGLAALEAWTSSAGDSAWLEPVRDIFRPILKSLSWEALKIMQEARDGKPPTDQTPGVPPAVPPQA